MRIGYADPPYPGCAHKYKDHKDYAGEVDHYELCARLLEEYDGFILHTSSVALREVYNCFAQALPLVVGGDALKEVGIRVMAWVKPFCAFKRNVPVAYSWEPVFVRRCRKPVVSGRITMRDHISCNITMKKGLTGAKPPEVARWAFEMVGAVPSDELDDMYPGTGIIEKTWHEWCAEVG